MADPSPEFILAITGIAIVCIAGYFAIGRGALRMARGKRKEGVRE